MSYLLHGLCAIAVALVVAGCEKPASAGVPGTYFADYIGDRDEIQLRSNGTYTHALGKSEFKQVDTGKWMVETLPNEGLGISLYSFRFRDHNGQTKPPGIWHVEVNVGALSGEYRLCFDPDLGSCFIKKN